MPALHKLNTVAKVPPKLLERHFRRASWKTEFYMMTMMGLTLLLEELFAASGMQAVAATGGRHDVQDLSGRTRRSIAAWQASLLLPALFSR